MKIPKDSRWDSVRTLGQGGQGTVILVKDRTGDLQGEYALKALQPGKATKAYERFAREIEVMKSIDHPAIIKIIDHSQPGDAFQFYVMEYIEGATSLKQLLGSNDNPFLREALNATRLFRQLTEALSICEEKNIVHRDLSPANVLVLKGAKIKLIDFGLCQKIDAETITLTDEGVGTPNYMAPECESGAEGVVTSASDFYSIGKILWAAVTGSQAFSREQPVYGPKSLPKLFPNETSLWHLHHLFEGTIRHTPKNRFAKTKDALAAAHRVENLITSGSLPLELIGQICPLCKWGSLGNFEGSHVVFGNPNPRGIRAIQCKHCGYCFAQSVEVQKNELDRRAALS